MPILRQEVICLSKKLSLKQKKFADEYIICGNATQAAKKAGYSKNYANTNVPKLLNNPKIKSYIDKRLKEIDDELIADQKEVLKYLTSVMRGQTSDETLMSVGDFVQEKTEIRVSSKDRIRAAELLGKRYGTWTDKVDMTLEVPTIISGDDDLVD